MSASKVLLIVGAGGNVGSAVAKKFRSHGYKVALASRTYREDIAKLGDKHFAVDVSDASSIAPLFEKVKSELGVPGVVVYNGT